MRWGLLGILATALVFAVAQPSQASILAQYPFGTETPLTTSAASTDTDLNSVASLFSDGDGTLNFATTPVSLGNPIPSVFKAYTAMPLAINLSGNSYFSFTITPNAGYKISLTSLVFDIQKDKATGGQADPKPTVDIRSNAGGDSFLTSIFSQVLTRNDGKFAVDLTAVTNALRFQNVPTGIEFRFYFSALDTITNSALGIHLDNVELNGASAPANNDPLPVPEPTSFALLGLGAFGLLWARKRHAA